MLSESSFIFFYYVSVLCLYLHALFNMMLFLVIIQKVLSVYKCILCTHINMYIYVCACTYICIYIHTHKMHSHG